MTSPGSIDIVLDHLALAPSAVARRRWRPSAGLDLLPAAEALLEEAAQMHVPVRLVLAAAPTTTR